MKHGRFGGLWSDKRSHVLKMHEGGLSIRKIASELKISPSRVRKALHAVEVQKVLKMARTAVQEGAQ